MEFRCECGCAEFRTYMEDGDSRIFRRCIRCNKLHPARPLPSPSGVANYIPLDTPTTEGSESGQGSVPT